MALGAELRSMGDDVAAVIARAVEREMELKAEVEKQKARADAAAINAEQTCSMLEQRYVSLMGQTTLQETEKSQLSMMLDSKSAELAQAQQQANQLELQLIKIRTDVETKEFELKEVHAAKKELLDTLALKNTELEEKNASMSCYLDKVLALTEEKSSLESKILENATELVQARARQSRLEQEKDITAQHNAWLNNDLSSKVSLLLEERQRTTELETALQQKISEIERITKEKDEALVRSQERIKDLEVDLEKRITELRFVTDDAAAKEELLSNESSTASKLAELYKKSSEEWSKKASDLEGVIMALETHLAEMQKEYEEKMQKEVEARQSLEKEAAETKAALEKRIAELEKSRAGGHDLLELDGREMAMIEASGSSAGNGQALPNLPVELSSTALAASLLRDGWTIGKIYREYQEMFDSWRHERQERVHNQNLLTRVLREIEEKAVVILEERAEYQRLVQGYKVMEESMRFSVTDQAALEMTIRELKAELRRKERDVKNAAKDVSDLQYQVSVLLKECSDIQKRHGLVGAPESEAMSVVVSPVPDTTATDAVISENLMTFKDIGELVEYNTKIRSLLRVLANDSEEKEKRLKEKFDSELKKHIDAASEKVSTVLQKADEQSQMIESLRGTIGMYKRLYEEERRSTPLKAGPTSQDLGRENQDVRRLMDMAQEEIRAELKKANEQLAGLEQELTTTRHELRVARAEFSRSQAEASFAREQLASTMRDSEEQRKQMDSVLLRNMELSQTILDFQRRLKESSQNAQAAEEQARKYSVEVSVLEREKTLLANAEQRASSEAAELSERLHRLQTRLATIESAEEVREVLRASERKKLEDDINRLQREWVEAKNQLELERNHVTALSSQRDKAIGQATERVEALTLELKGAATRISNFEIRAKVAESRCVELESSLKKADEKIMAVLSGGKRISVSDSNAEMLEESREEAKVLREELTAVKAHAEQYKKMSATLEEALKRLEEEHLRTKAEATDAQKELDSELKTLQKQLSEVETHSLEKEKEAGAMQANKEGLLRDALRELASFRDAEAANRIQREQYEERIKLLTEELEKQRSQWRAAQNNYERQVLLQADTIRELDAACERLSKLESQEKQLLETAAKAESELESVKVTFYMEKEAWAGKEASMENRIKELDFQNSLLLDRAEARHVKLAEQERRAAAGESSSAETSDEAGLQNVISYLRRAKEAADTEISLLKQERARLTKQFEAASSAAEEAQAMVRQHHEKIQSSLFSEEEFRALQSQMMELHLLREDNAKLREENKKATEETSEMKAKLAQLEEKQDSWRKSLRERELELESARSEVEFLKSEVQRWQRRVSQILEKYKALDVDDYERVKSLLVDYEERFKKSQEELEGSKKLHSDVQGENVTLNQRVQDLSKRVQEVEAISEKARRAATATKRKLDAEISKKVEEYKASSEAAHHEALEAAQKEINTRSEQTARYEQIHKEKETRIQILEKTLDKEREELKKEREELRKEKLRREKDRKIFMDMAKNLKEKDGGGLRQQALTIVGTTPEPQASTGTATVQSVAEEPPAPRLPPPVEVEVSSVLVPPPVPVPDAPAAAATTLSVVNLRSTQVAAAARKTDPEKEKEIQELRATIFEKEKLRKSGRPRIVRPRIETQPDVSSEAAEPHVEGGGDGVPSEMEADVTRTVDATEPVAPLTSHKRSAPETVSVEPVSSTPPPPKKARAGDAVTAFDQMEGLADVPGEEGVKRVRFTRPDSSQQQQQQLNEGDAEKLKLRDKSPEPVAAEEVPADADIVEGEEMLELVPVEDDGMVTEEQRELPSEPVNEETGFMEIGETSDYPEDGEIPGAVEEEAAPEGDVADPEQTGGDKEEQDPAADNPENAEEMEEAKTEGDAIEEQPPEQQQQAPEVTNTSQPQAASAVDVSTPEEAGKAARTAPAATPPPPSTRISIAERARERSALRQQDAPPRGRGGRPVSFVKRKQSRGGNNSGRGGGAGGN